MDISTIILYGSLALGGVIFILLSINMFFIVDQQTTAVIERFGKFARTAGAGLNVKIPLIERVVTRVNLRISQLDVDVETKTKDNVFVNTKVSVQYFIKPDKVYDAFYKLNNPRAQIGSYIFDIVRAEVPKLELDDVFEKKDDIANAIKSELTEQMENFGYSIQKSLITDLDPNSKVKAAMNQINAAKRLKHAAAEEAEAQKITVVKAAEAEAESKKLQGEGIAAQRKAIIDGLNTSVHEFMEGVPGSKPDDVMSLVLLTQYFDTLTHIGANSRTNTVFIPHSPSGLADISSQIRNGVLQGEAASLNGRLEQLLQPTEEAAENE